MVVIHRTAVAAASLLKMLKMMMQMLEVPIDL